MLPRPTLTERQRRERVLFLENGELLSDAERLELHVLQRAPVREETVEELKWLLIRARKLVGNLLHLGYLHGTEAMKAQREWRRLSGGRSVKQMTECQFVGPVGQAYIRHTMAKQSFKDAKSAWLAARTDVARLEARIARMNLEAA